VSLPVFPLFPCEFPSSCCWENRTLIYGVCECRGGKKTYKMYGYIGGKGADNDDADELELFLICAGQGKRVRGRGKTSQRETDIETDAGRLHEHISYIYRNDSRGPSLPRLLLLFVTNGGKTSSLSLHRMSPSRFLRPASLISHSSMLHLQQEQPQNNNKREKKLQMQFVTHKFKKHKNETVAGKTGAQRTRVTCRFSIVRKLIYKTQRCGLAFLRFLRPSTYPPNLHFPLGAFTCYNCGY